MFIYSQMPPVGGGDPTGGSNATPLAAFLLAGAEAVSPVSCSEAGNKISSLKPTYTPVI